MTRMLDCRTDEIYNEKNLKPNDALKMIGFDWCYEEAADNFFDNLDVYFNDDSVLIDMLNKELPDSMKREYEFKRSFVPHTDEMRDVNTFGDLLRMCLLDWIESSRNELIMSMIDNN